jgi:hypothetical protein
MKKLLLLGAIALFINVSAQKGKIFPNLSGETLEGKAFEFPPKNGKLTVVAFVFKRSAEDELKRWLQPLWASFMDKPDKKNPMDMTESYDVNFVFIPMIGGLKKVRDEYKENTDKGFWPYVVDTKKADMSAEKTMLEIEDGKVPYVMVLDKNGKILEVQSGNYTKDKLSKIEDACEDN